MKLRLGTRGSRLALAQAALAEAWLHARYPSVEVETIVVRSAGDGSTAPFTAENRGMFVKELEHALLRDEIDVACHSAKDVTFSPPDELVLAAFLPRGDARDALVGATALEVGMRVGTSSSRRRAQLLALEPELRILPLRGNVDRRLERLHAGEYDAIVVSAAGLELLRRQSEIDAHLDPDEFVPEPGQGGIVLQTRRGDETRVDAVDHPRTRAAIEAERECGRLTGGGCAVPVAAHWAAGIGRAAIIAADGTWSIRAAGSEPAQVAADLLDRLPDDVAA
jgi:hydroxymethylbilane synthase